MIMDFSLFPGTRVTESELAAQFEVSRTPVREALQRLQVEGMVDIRSKQGCFIRQVDTQSISYYYDVRVALESMAVEIACQNMPKAEVETICEQWNPKHCNFEFDYPGQIQDVEEEFHMRLAEGSGNYVLAQYLQDANDHIRVIRRLGFPDKKSILETYEEHFEICTLILAGKAAAAKKAMTTHIRKSQNIAKNVTLNQLEQHRRGHIKKKRRKTPRSAKQLT